MRARFGDWLEHATDAELEAFNAHCSPDPELATFTNEQLEAVIRGVPLATVRAMQHPVT